MPIRSTDECLLCRAEPSVPLDLQLVFGTPHDPMSSQRFTPSDRRLSLAMMTYMSSFVRTGSGAALQRFTCRVM